MGWCKTLGHSAASSSMKLTTTTHSLRIHQVAPKTHGCTERAPGGLGQLYAGEAARLGATLPQVTDKQPWSVRVMLFKWKGSKQGTPGQGASLLAVRWTRGHCMSVKPRDLHSTSARTSVGADDKNA